MVSESCLVCINHIGKRELLQQYVFERVMQICLEGALSLLLIGFSLCVCVHVRALTYFTSSHDDLNRDTEDENLQDATIPHCCSVWVVTLLACSCFCD
jgi:hypothetical protein